MKIRRIISIVASILAMVIATGAGWRIIWSGCWSDSNCSNSN